MTLDDSDRNILASLAHEADEPCAVCHEPVSPMPCNPPGSFRWEFTLDEDGEIPVHEECLTDAREAAEDARAEAILEARWADSEAEFNRRWPT
jgi:hypothetical protein